MDTSPAQVQPHSSWPARIFVSIVCLATMILVGASLVLLWQHFGDNYDFPPTWYWALTILLSLVDIFAICYLGFLTIRLLASRAAPSRVLRSVAVVFFSLFVVHIATVTAYSRIPQWDFQNSLFDDLSWPGPGKIEQDCKAIPNQSPSQQATMTISPEPDAQQPANYQEIKQIALLVDPQTRYKNLENKMATGWHGWIRDLSRHGYYSNAQDRLIRVFLRDPYSHEDTSGYYGQQPEAVLSYFSPSDVDKLSVGQEVLICGRVRDAIFHEGDIRISISSPVMNPIPLPEALTTTQVPADFLLEYEAHGCGRGSECPEYNLRIDAKGNVAYNGIANVLITGTHTISIPEDKLKELAFELQRTDFFSISGLPTKLEDSPTGTTVLKARLDGKTKSIVLGLDGKGWSTGVYMLIGKIEEVSSLHQWVNLVTSP